MIVRDFRSIKEKSIEYLLCKIDRLYSDQTVLSQTICFDTMSIFKSVFIYLLTIDYSLDKKISIKKCPIY